MSGNEREAELNNLRQRLADAEGTLQAIYKGDVDALVVNGPDGPQVFTLQNAQEPYRLLVERMNEGAITVAPDGTILYSNQHFANLLAQPLELIIGKPLTAFAAGPDLSALMGLLKDGANQPTRHELSLVAADHTIVPVLASAGPLVLDETIVILIIVTDLTAQRHWEEIAAAEQFARSILEQATDAVLVCDETGRITKVSWFAQRLFDRPLLGQDIVEAIPMVFDTNAEWTEERPTPEMVLHAVRTGQPIRAVEVCISIDSLADRYFLLSAGPLNDRNGQSMGLIVTLTDITERKRSEEHQTLLVAELNHRVKNILAIVQSLAGQTLASSESITGFRSAFEGRLRALSLAHDILTRVRWGKIELETLIAQSLAPYLDSERTGHIRWSGPLLLLPSYAIVPLAIVLHELATNAAKYGSFSNQAGCVDVEWRLVNDVIQFTWAEQNGPHLNNEIKPGFGSKLISRVVAYDLGGSVDLKFASEGFRCELSFPFPGVETERA